MNAQKLNQLRALTSSADARNIDASLNYMVLGNGITNQQPSDVRMT